VRLRSIHGTQSLFAASDDFAVALGAPCAGKIWCHQEICRANECAPKSLTASKGSVVLEGRPGASPATARYLGLHRPLRTRPMRFSLHERIQPKALVASSAPANDFGGITRPDRRLGRFPRVGVEAVVVCAVHDSALARGRCAPSGARRRSMSIALRALCAGPCARFGRPWAVARSAVPLRPFHASTHSDQGSTRHQARPVRGHAAHASERTAVRALHSLGWHSGCIPVSCTG
jgi:hypothetical protein